MMPEKDPTYPPGLPLQFPSALAAFHAPLPIDQRTHDARYVWDPTGRLHHGAFHPPAPHGLSGSGLASPSLSELSFLHQRRAVAGSPVDLHALHSMYRVNPYIDQICGSALHASPAGSLRGLPPLDARGLPVGADYYNMSGLAGRCLGDPGSLAASTLGGSAELPFSLESSRLNSPRPSSIRQTRKRALSASPFSDSFDINSMIRFSPNSLVSIVNGSRSSSASGSYGHLSADLSLSGALSPAFGMHPVSMGSGHLQQLQHLMRTGSLPSSPHFLTHNSLFPPTPSHLSQQGLFHPQAGCPNTIKSEDSKKELPSLVSSTVESPDGCRKSTKVKKESASANSIVGFDDKGAEVSDPMKDEPGDFVETHCHWKECDKEFNIQDELVKHINNDHIHANKKSFICRWKDCSREEKPFKAQYMLVVHMRRHTGEKPHRCTFEGCAKAYSRLENLKTHLRSHTGEKPYMCEFPGCTKAFSNASDRAKHQNRTHSNEKPYVCKAPGCSKRYTDPSSLRKHVKTVHGPEFYASKKHKGNDQPCGKSQRRDELSKDFDGGAGNEASPARSEECSGKTTSVSSPSVKSEDPTSPNSQKSQGSPAVHSDITSMNYSCPSNEPVSDNVVSTTNETSDYLEESDWTIGTDAEDIETPDLAVSAVNIINSTTAGGNAVETFSIEERNDRNRLKNRINLKGMVSSSNIPPLSGGMRRMISGPTDIGRDHIESRIQTRSKTQGDMPPGRGSHLLGSTTTIRRDSNSTVSSYYGSMKSDVSLHPLSSQFSSRRSSEVSQVSSQGGNRLATIPSPGYDPISPGSSRRSSDISITPQSIPGNMVSHLQKLHRRAFDSQDHNPLSNLVVQTQKMALDQSARRNFLGTSGYSNFSAHPVSGRMMPNRELRRASDPVKTTDRQHITEGGLTRHNSYSSFHHRRLPPNHQYRQTSGSFHPNSNFHLDQMSENQMVEDRLVIPDEMASYLNQVEDHVGQDHFRDKSVVNSPRQPQCSTPYNNGQPMSPACGKHSHPSPGYGSSSVCSPSYKHPPKSPATFDNPMPVTPSYGGQAQGSPGYMNQAHNPTYMNHQQTNPLAQNQPQSNQPYPSQGHINPSYPNQNQASPQFHNQPYQGQMNTGAMYQQSSSQPTQRMMYHNTQSMSYPNSSVPPHQANYNTKPNNMPYCGTPGQSNYPTQQQSIPNPYVNQQGSSYPSQPHVVYNQQNPQQSAMPALVQMPQQNPTTDSAPMVSQGPTQMNQSGNYQYAPGTGMTTGYPQSLPSPAQANYNQAVPANNVPPGNNVQQGNLSVPSPVAATPAPQCFHQPLPPPYPGTQAYSEPSSNAFSNQQYPQGVWPQQNHSYPSESYPNQANTDYTNYPAQQSNQHWQGQVYNATPFPTERDASGNGAQMSYNGDMPTTQVCPQETSIPVPHHAKPPQSELINQSTQGYQTPNGYQCPRQSDNNFRPQFSGPYHVNPSEVPCGNGDKPVLPYPDNPADTSQNTVTMKPDTYQRTLEYVQQCQSWTQKNSSPKVNGATTPKPPEDSLRTHAMLSMSMGALYPMSNMVVNDMNTSVSSLIEESKYYQTS